MEECSYFQFGGGYCKYHQKLRQDKKPKKISPFSQKHLEQLKIYKVVRLEFLNENAFCQAKLEGCTRIATQVHHRAGRLGDKLTDKNNFLAVCHLCHCTIENSPNMAKELGLSFDRY